MKKKLALQRGVPLRGVPLHMKDKEKQGKAKMVQEMADDKMTDRNEVRILA